MIKTKHLFLLSAIVDKLDLDQALESLFAKGKMKKTKQEIGKDVIFAIAKKLHKAEKEVIKLLASITGKTEKETEDLPMKETLEILKKMLAEEGVLDFLHKQQEG